MAPCVVAFLLLLHTLPAQEAPATIPDWQRRLLPADESWRATAQRFVFNNDAEPETLDPALAKGVSELRLIDALFAGLTSLDPATLAARPGLAERWQHSDDGLVYDFYLRAGLHWSDGRALTAQDLVDSWRRVLDPATGSDYAQLLFPIQGAEGLLRRQADAPPFGAEALNARHLRVRLHSPVPFFPDLCAFGTYKPVPLHAIASHGAAWTRPEHIVVSGAFRLVEWRPRDRIRLLPNDHYYDRWLVKLDEIVVLPWDDLDTAWTRYQAGGVHWLPSIPAARVEAAKRHGDYYVAPYLGSYFYRFNCTRAPFDDVRVRRALSQAVDRRVITRHILRAGQLPAHNFVPAGTGHPPYEPVAGLPYDPAAARALLAEAGFPDGTGFPRFELVYNTSETHRQIAENVAQQWRDNLGIGVSLRNLEWRIYLQETSEARRNYDVARAAWIGDYNDPSTFLDMFISGGGNNRTGWSHSGYDDLVRASARASEPLQRLQLFRQMERILVEEQLPIMPIYIYVSQGLLREEVRGFHENVRAIHPLEYLWLERWP